MANNRKIAYTLLGILQEYAPNAAAQQICANIFNEEPTNKSQVIRMINALADGLKFGNWPWTTKEEGK